MGRQPTMADIARQAGVSRVAVSYALNGRPGVSSEVREEILRIARELGFSANGAAQALHGAVAEAVGLTMRRPDGAFQVEVFRRELISGIQVELSTAGFGLALQFVRGVDEEIAVYQRWAGERRVAGVLVCDLAVPDTRIPVLAKLSVPTVVIGGPLTHKKIASIWSDTATPVHETVGYLATLGHQRITRIAGPDGLVHTVARTAAFRKACQESGVDGRVLTADYTGEAGAQVTRRMLSTASRPTAIIYDNDVMAVAGLGVAMEMGVAVPGELSIVALEDSPLCQVVRPALTVVKRDITGYGANAARLLLESIAGLEPRSVLDHTARLVVRASTGPVRITV
jgi:DNA-binding LacI/PurR family transcriptional regulator